MNNEILIRRLIRGSFQRAVQESLASLILLAVFGTVFAKCQLGSNGFWGCLWVLGGAGFIVAVVWSHRLKHRLLREHPPHDVDFWRQAFRGQARLLRWVPLWYCTPLGVGCLFLLAPPTSQELLPFLVVAGLIVAVFAGVAWWNRRASRCLGTAAGLLVAETTST